MKHPLIINSEGKIVSGVDKEILEFLQSIIDDEDRYIYQALQGFKTDDKS